MLSDLEAIKAIERLCRAAPRNLDLEALRVWIAPHCGLNPHAAGPLDPDAPLLAERDKLRAKVSPVFCVVMRLSGLGAATAATVARVRRAALARRPCPAQRGVRRWCRGLWRGRVGRRGLGATFGASFAH